MPRSTSSSPGWRPRPRPNLALIYYRNAIEGRWTGRSDQADANVRHVRLETAEYLIALGRQSGGGIRLISAEEHARLQQQQAKPCPAFPAQRRRAPRPDARTS